MNSTDKGSKWTIFTPEAPQNTSTYSNAIPKASITGSLEGTSSTATWVNIQDGNTTIARPLNAFISGGAINAVPYYPGKPEPVVKTEVKELGYYNWLGYFRRLVNLSKHLEYRKESNPAIREGIDRNLILLLSILENKLSKQLD